MINLRLLHLLTVSLLTFVYPWNSSGYTVAVFGGSGFVGRRITQTLIHAGCDVISISRSGKPPSYYHNDATDNVHWIQWDVDPDGSNNNDDDESLELPTIDAAISCIGNVNPKSEWDSFSFWGLAWDDDRLYYQNGIVNQHICNIAKEAGAKRFVYLSVSYEVAKMLEGPITGYMDGKRLAEHSASETFGNDNAIMLGPSLIYGGKRFKTVGTLYRQFVESPLAKVYLGGMKALRSLSTNEDWVEQSLFSPPINVDVVARVASAAAVGKVTRDFVGKRRQGFFDSNGQSVEYDDVIFVDGTNAMESMDQVLGNDLSNLDLQEEGSRIPASWISRNDKVSSLREMEEEEEPPFEGALVGKRSYLLPLPVALILSSIAYGMTSGLFLPVAQI